MAELVFGEVATSASANIAAIQAPGGCGALRVLAELIVRAAPEAKVWVSDPTWANHVPLIGEAGIEILALPTSWSDF